MSVNGISLTSSMNQSLHNLNNTTNNLNKSLQSLSTGQKNRSTDPTRFSMAQSLLSQMSDIADKKDSMTNSITAGNMAQAGYEGVTSLLRSAQGVVSAAQSTSDPNSQANYAASYQNIVDQANQMASDAGISSSALPLIPPNNLNANSTSQLATSITALHGEAAASASSLATTPILQAFSDSMINTLQTGADNLTLTDLNEQAANVLMQQTQQQLGIASIGMSAKSAQSVLKQFA
jgi:flagellin